MADYDWFTPTPAQLVKEAEEKLFQKEFKVNTVSTSTAVSTTFYYCQLCGAVLVHNAGFVKAHRKRCYEIDESQGKHRLESS